MPKEAFGGGDEGGEPEEKKKPGLSKFGLAPDTNIRDLFWKIMASYAATKKPGVELASLDNDRFALMRASLSVLSREDAEQYGMTPRFIANYSLMMLIDAEWEDAFIEFMEKSYESKTGIQKHVAHCIPKLLTNEHYGGRLEEYFRLMVRQRDTEPVALAYLAMMKNRELSGMLKKELVILARGDIGQNQRNAIKAISVIKDDEDVKKTLIMLLSHWDGEARLAAAEALAELSGDPEVAAAAKKRANIETEIEVKRILEKIAK